MYNEYLKGITSECVGKVFEGEMTELDFYYNISKGINYFVLVDELNAPILVCTHRVISVGTAKIALGDYFWIRSDKRGDELFMQESMILFKQVTASPIVISQALPEYVDTFKFVYSATDLLGGVYLV